MSVQRWTTIFVATAIGLGVLLQIPQWIHTSDPRYQGILVKLNSDEEVYLARVQESLNGRGKQTDEAFVGDPHTPGSQFGIIERVIGAVFRPTGWTAATVLQVMDSIAPPLLFLVIVWLLLLMGFRPSLAYAGSMGFVLVNFYSLNRPIHPTPSFLLTFASAALLLQGLRGHKLSGILGGVLLGIQVGDYIWSWTWAWLFWGLLVAVEFGEWGWSRYRGTFVSASRWLWLCVYGMVGVVVASPFLWKLFLLSRDPLYEEVAFRSGMHPSRLPESWPYSILFTVMLLGIIAACITRTDLLRRYRAPIVLAATAWLAMNQQLIHGVTFNFVSHYLFALSLAAIVVVLFAVVERSRWLQMSAVASVIYLAALGYDGRYALGQFQTAASDYREQHLASALPVLDQLPRTRILSDPLTSMFIAGHTRHDVAYGLYLKNVVMSHQELAERYCLTVLPKLPAERRLAEQEHLIYPDSVSAFKDDPSVRVNELRMIEQACTRQEQAPEKAVDAFDVDYVLWNEKQEPTWSLERLKRPVTKVSSGSGWSLWKL